MNWNIVYLGVFRMMREIRHARWFPGGFHNFASVLVEMFGPFGSCRIPDASSRECDRIQLIAQWHLWRCQSSVCAISSCVCAYALRWLGGACGAGGYDSGTYYITGQIGCALLLGCKKTAGGETPLVA